MFEQSPEFKRAAIDWVLAHGQSESMHHSTREALTDLAVRGVDYEASEVPDFRRVAVEPGDSFTEATYAEAFSCEVYPVDPEQAGNQFRYDGYTFYVGDEDMKRIFLHQMIVGVLAAADSGDAEWKARVERLTARITRRAASEGRKQERRR